MRRSQEATFVFELTDWTKEESNWFFGDFSFIYGDFVFFAVMQYLLGFLSLLLGVILMCGDFWALCASTFVYWKTRLRKLLNYRRIHINRPAGRQCYYAFSFIETINLFELFSQCFSPAFVNFVKFLQLQSHDITFLSGVEIASTITEIHAFYSQLN